MDWLTIIMAVGLFVLVFWFLSRRGKQTRKAVIESMDKSTESNNRLAEAVNRLADIIAKK